MNNKLDEIPEIDDMKRWIDARDLVEYEALKLKFEPEESDITTGDRSKPFPRTVLEYAKRRGYIS